MVLPWQRACHGRTSSIGLIWMVEGCNNVRVDTKQRSHMFQTLPDTGKIPSANPLRGPFPRRPAFDPLRFLSITSILLCAKSRVNSSLPILPWGSAATGRVSSNQSLEGSNTFDDLDYSCDYTHLGVDRPETNKTTLLESLFV